MLGAEMMRQQGGAPARDLSIYSSWRRALDPENLSLMDLYGRYLVGQYAGMSSALSLDAVRAALDIEGTPRAEWPELTRRLTFLHRLIVEELKAQKESGGG